MSIRYDKLFALMTEKNISNGQLQKQAGFSANIITRLKRNQYISLESIEGICRALECGVDPFDFFLIRRRSSPYFPARQLPIQRRRQPEAAGYAEDLPGCIGGLIAGKVDDRCGDLLRQTNATQRNVPEE